MVCIYAYVFRHVDFQICWLYELIYHLSPETNAQVLMLTTNPHCYVDYQPALITPHSNTINHPHIVALAAYPHFYGGVHCTNICHSLARSTVS